MTGIAVVFLVTFLSSAVQLLTGFGFAIVMMALLPLFLPHEIGLYLSIIGGTLLSAWLAWKNRKNIQWKLVPLPAVFSVLGTVAGLFLNASMSNGVYMRVLGIFLILLALWFLLFSKKVQIPSTPLTAAIAGILGGAGTALFAVGGPPLVLYYVSAVREKESYMGTLNMALVISSCATAVLRSVLLGWPEGMAMHFLPWAIALVAGSWVGKTIFNQINGEQMKKIIYIFMCIVGLYFALTA